MKIGKMCWAHGLVASLLMLSWQTQAATVSFSPSSSPVNNGDTFSVDLVGTSFTQVLDGGGLNIAFDPSILQVDSVAINLAQWDSSPLSGPGTIDNTGGSISGLFFNSFANRSGELLFATLTFEAISAGVSNLNLTEYQSNPFSSGGDLYAGLSLVGGSVDVSPVPAPATAWLLMTGIGGLTLRRLRAMRNVA